jgi:hypothetical protein
MKRLEKRIRDMERRTEPPEQFVPVLTLSVRNPDGSVEKAYDSRDHGGLQPMVKPPGQRRR